MNAAIMSSRGLSAYSKRERQKKKKGRRKEGWRRGKERIQIHWSAPQTPVTSRLAKTRNKNRILVSYKERHLCDPSPLSVSVLAGRWNWELELRIKHPQSNMRQRHLKQCSHFKAKVPTQEIIFHYQTLCTCYLLFRKVIILIFEKEF